jgi:hypothetical protein
MIAPVRPFSSSRARSPAWHVAFLAMLPAIVAHARLAFRRLDPEARQDAIQEVVANAYRAYARLVHLKKAEIAYPTVLARYAVAQYHDGRRVGNRLNVQDVLSPYAQRRKGFTVQRLDRRDPESGGWMEAVVEDPKTPPPDQAAFRIDFHRWLDELPRRNRRVAECLALGNSTSQVAKRFRVSAGRVSQLRRELADEWQRYQGDFA